MKKKILYITARSDMGGGPKHLLELCQGSLNKYQIFVAAPAQGHYAPLFKQYSHDFIEIPFRKFSLKSFFSLLNFCKDNQVQLIHSHGRGAGIYSKLLGLFGLKVIHTLHGAHKPDTLKGVLTVFIENILRHLVSHYIFVSKSEKEMAKSLNIIGPKESIIPNGVNERKFQDQPEYHNVKYLGTLSRLDSHKNNIELINFMHELPDYKLLIAGDGDEMESLRKNAPDNVELIGRIDDTPSFLGKIEIYVSASKGEGLPYSLIEAVASGKKMVASDVTGHRDVLNQDQLYELGSFKSFKACLESAYSIPLDSKYTLEASLKATHEVYDLFL